MKPNRLFTIAQPRGQQFDSTPGSSRPQYTLAEVGQALGGMDCDTYEQRVIRDRAYAAFAWREAADLRQRGVLYSHLTREVWLGDDMNPKLIPVATRENWPGTVANQTYMDKLVKLAIDEDRMTRHAGEPFPLDPVHPFFNKLLEAKGLRDITENLWRRRLQRHYTVIRQIMLTWYADAWYHANAKLGND